MSLHHSPESLAVKHKFLTLDGMRGAVACLVFMHHTKSMFGGFDTAMAYLAVDLFFVLSGFVIADAYSIRLKKGLGFIQFMRIRLARLYPLY